MAPDRDRPSGRTPWKNGLSAWRSMDPLRVAGRCALARIVRRSSLAAVTRQARFTSSADHGADSRARRDRAPSRWATHRIYVQSFDYSGVQLCSVAAMPFEAARSRRPKNALQAYGPATAMQIARKINVGHEIDGRRRVFPRCRAGSPALNTSERAPCKPGSPPRTPARWGGRREASADMPAPSDAHLLRGTM